jgi:mono/diheme cytochrome c family protein
MLATLFALSLSLQAAVTPAADPAIERGRTLIRFSGCNDCHTPGYAQAAGKVPEAQWLTGDLLGWSGPWGTTYPANLRLKFNAMDENAFVIYARQLTTRPPMPFWVLNELPEQDLRAIWRYVHALGSAGSAAPAGLPPGVEPKGPAVRFPGPPPATAGSH